MHYVIQLLAIAGVIFLSAVSPGPNFAMVTSAATMVSRRAGMLAGLGLAAASLTWATLAVAGLGLVLSEIPWIGTTIKATGAVYLLWIGAKMLLGSHEPTASLDPVSPHAIRAASRAYLVSMTNPKSIVFYCSILGLMMPASAPAWFLWSVPVLAALVSAVWYCGLALLLSLAPVARLFVKGRRAIETAMGSVLVFLGGKLLLE